MVLARDICGARTIYIPCLHHLYPVRAPHIGGVITAYIWYKHMIYRVVVIEKISRLTAKNGRKATINACSCSVLS